MSSKVRPYLGAALFAAAAVAGVVAARRGSFAAAPTGPVAEAAEAARRDLETELRAERDALTAKVREAAALPRLQAAIAARVDAATIIDLFSTEIWWRPVRDEFRISRVVAGGETATFGAFESAGEERVLIAAARKEGATSALLVVKSQPYLMTAARLTSGGGDDAPVLMMAKPCDSAWLGEIANRARVGLMLTDDQAPMMTAGAASLRGFLHAIGPRTSGTVVGDPARRWGAAQIDLGSGLRLWALRAVPGGESSLPAGEPWHWWVATLALAACGVLVSLHNRAPILPPSHGASAPPTDFPQTTRNPAAAPAPDTGSLEGKNFGRYRLVKKIADGGMSEIYRAVAHGPEGFSRNFVVKRLKPELARQKEAVSQFIDEARVQASLVHSNVVPVFDFGNLNNEYFMTEEYISGRDVLQFSERCYQLTGVPMDRRIAYYIAHETLQALHYAHTRSDSTGEALDIVHRDVSSLNIMVAASGDVKLADFGIAKANTRVMRTQAGVIKGNAHFMSPEHARGQMVDARSDVFCVGLVLYYCLTNQTLYTGANDFELLYRAGQGPTEAELEMVDMLESPAPLLLRRALAIDPAARFQSAGHFAAALAPYIAGAKSVTSDLVQALFGEELRAEMG